jgi:hypothetical protein
MDFDDFYTMKSYVRATLGLKLKIKKKIFGGSFRGAKFLMRMLSLFLRRFSLVWANFFFLLSF